MKPIKKIIGAVGIMSLCFLTNAKAATLTDAEYAKLKNVFTDARISTMTDEEAQRYLSYNLENAETVSKYYKVTETANGTTSVEVSQEEAENAFDSVQNPSTRASYHETAYKNIRITTSLMSGSRYFVSLINRWLVTPNKKSYDVIAMRTDDAQVEDGTQHGAQTYWAASIGTYNTVNYSANGTNINKQSNGYGISMNLVDDASYFECDTDAMITATTKYAEVFGTYQHATKNVTLAQSKAYIISHNGYGKVLNFTTSVVDYYDGMQGVSIALPYNG